MSITVLNIKVSNSVQIHASSLHFLGYASTCVSSTSYLLITKCSAHSKICIYSILYCPLRSLNRISQWGQKNEPASTKWARIIVARLRTSKAVTAKYVHNHNHLPCGGNIKSIQVFPLLCARLRTNQLNNLSMQANSILQKPLFGILTSPTVRPRYLCLQNVIWSSHFCEVSFADVFAVKQDLCISFFTNGQLGFFCCKRQSQFYAAAVSRDTYFKTMENAEDSGRFFWNYYIQKWRKLLLAVLIL